MPEVGQKISPLSRKYSETLENNFFSEPSIVFGQTATGLNSFKAPESAVVRASRHDRDRLRAYRRKMIDLNGSPRAEVYKQVLTDFLETGKKANPDKHAGFDQAIEALNHQDESVDFVSLDLIDDTSFINMLELHNRTFREKSEQLQGDLPELKAEFKDKFKAFVKEKGIDLSEDVIDDRIDNTRVELADALTTTFEGIGGDFDPERGIRISEQALVGEGRWKDSLRKILAHELVHAISGRTATFKEDDSGFSEFDQINHQRIGFTFKGVFRWLNEAVTENIARNIYPDDFPTYETFQRIYKYLRDYGEIMIPDTDFYDAYFENYDPDIPGEQRIPHWKKLWTQINLSYGVGFMTRINRDINNGKIIDVFDAFREKSRLLQIANARIRAEEKGK